MNLSPWTFEDAPIQLIVCQWTDGKMDVHPFTLSVWKTQFDYYDWCILVWEWYANGLPPVLRDSLAHPEPNETHPYKQNEQQCKVKAIKYARRYLLVLRVINLLAWLVTKSQDKRK